MQDTKIYLKFCPHFGHIKECEPFDDGAIPYTRTDTIPALTSEPTLTRRERFAMAAMQGLLSARPLADRIEVADMAINQADALIAELQI
mgnify:CR=1 FL=1